MAVAQIISQLLVISISLGAIKAAFDSKVIMDNTMQLIRTYKEAEHERLYNSRLTALAANLDSGYCYLQELGLEPAQNFSRNFPQMSTEIKQQQNPQLVLHWPNWAPTFRER